MRKTSALAVLEFSDIPAGVWAVDAILKKAPIAFMRAGTTTRGRYLVLFGGSTASTAESYDEALSRTGTSVLDHAFLPDVHPALFEAAFGARRTGSGSLLIIETQTAASVVRAVEAALKGTPIDLIEVRLSDHGLAGKGVAILAGTLHDVDAAAVLAASGSGVNALPPQGFVYRIIAAPHDMVEKITAVTRFDAAPLVDCDGEGS